MSVFGHTACMSRYAQAGGWGTFDLIERSTRASPTQTSSRKKSRLLSQAAFFALCVRIFRFMCPNSGLMCPATKKRVLDIEVLDVEGIFFDELAAAFDVLA